MLSLIKLIRLLLRYLKNGLSKIIASNIIIKLLNHILN